MDVVMHNAALDQNCSFCRLPSTVLENIALETCVVEPLGPPSDLIPLLLTCKHVYVQLAFLYNRHFYARIFRAKFDTRAASRRLGSRASYTANLANQLRIWCQCLTHIKRGDIMSSQTPKFLWAAFFMMVESDGKNEAQLLEWADLKTFVDRFVRERLWESRDEYHGWPAESSVNALALWLMWLTTDEETLKNESPEARRKLMELVRPYVVLPLRYPSFHAPDNHFDFPLPQDMRERLPYTHLTPHGFYPPYRKPETLAITHLHFNVRLEISVPPITIAAKLLYFARSEATPFDFPTNLPVDRAAAIAAGYLQPMPTQADYRQFNEHKGAKVLERGDWDWRSKMDEEEGKLEDDGFWRKGLKAKSARWDNDWQRWCYCFDPWQTPYLKGVVYTYGSLNGDWMGRMLIPDMNQYFGMATSMTFAPQVPSMTTLPISLRLREYHCINPEHPVAPGGSSYDILDDGISNGWFPNDLNIRELPTGARAENPNYGGSVSWYEMYREGKPNSHSEETCTQCQYRKEQEEEALQERVRAHKRASEEMSPDDSDDEQRGRAGGGDGDEQGTGSSHQRARRNRQTSPSMQRHLHEHGHGERQPGVTTPDGPGSGVDPNAGLRIEISESLGQDVDALLDEEMGSVDEEDDVEYWEEYMENTCHGIQDIIITGETIHSHGQAWQHYVYYGRVRRWDGLIALVRKPKFVTELGIAIFRGYLVGNQNLVGNWRAFTVNPHAIPLEGPFVASRSFTEEQ